MRTATRVRQKTAQLVAASIMLGGLLTAVVGVLALTFAPPTTCAPTETGPRVTVTRYTPIHQLQRATLL